MTDEEFDIFVEEAMAELDQKRQMLTESYGLGTHSNFVVEYENNLLTFFENERPIVVAKILPVASHIPEMENLKWFWANENLPESVREHSSAVKMLYDQTGYDVFNDPHIACDEGMAWEIAAMACKCLNAQGVYRIPHGNMHSYVLLLSVQKHG
ncbi:MAG: hypothetical protein IPG64_27150 [Haliea sp.]|nr:hypothetical protein [Haliea sp.]MBK6741270.1 hypothetical protein [Haliea sp.]